MKRRPWSARDCCAVGGKILNNLLFSSLGLLLNARLPSDAWIMLCWKFMCEDNCHIMYLTGKLIIKFEEKSK
jgi:hypothetical protein